MLLFYCFFFLQRKEKVKQVKKGFSLSLFLVTLPRDKKQEEKTNLEEYLSMVEQFWSSLHGFRKDAFFVFEISVPRIGEEISFYVACPRTLSESFAKHISSFWQEAEIRPIIDYNIFNPSGFSFMSEARLAKPSVLPIKNFQDIKSEPISSFTNVLTKLKKEGEGAAIQIILKPSKVKIGKQAGKVVELMNKGKKLGTALSESRKGVLGEFSAIFSSANKEKGKEKEREERIQLSPVAQKMIASISEKASRPIFDINLRVACSAETKERAQNILSQIESCFEQLNTVNLNQIKFSLGSQARQKKLFYLFSFRLMDNKGKMLLSTGEMAGLFHFPSAELRTPGLKWIKAKQAPPPPNLPEQGVIIGNNVFRGEQRPIRMKEEDRRRHFYTVGQTGTGKSALLKEMIRQDIEQGKGVAVIDPHGDLAEDVLGYVPLERAEDVVYFNPTDAERPMGLNMLEYDPAYPESKTFVANELIEIFEKLYNLKAHGFGGPVFEQYMRNSLLLVMDDPESGSTLIEVPRVLSDANFRKYKLSRCKNIVVRNFWEFEAEKAGGEASLANMVPYITSKMNVFIANDLVRPIISQEKTSFDIKKIMNEGKILIVNLSKGKLGDINSHLIGMIVVGKILLAAFARTDIREEERKDFYLYIDEFQNFTTDTISVILAEARKYRLSMIFAHQFIGQLEEEVKKSVFGNVGSMLSFRVGPEDAEFLEAEFGPVFSKSDLANFDNFNAAFRLLIDGEVIRPFNIMTIPPQESNVETGKLIKELSRSKYGRNRALVESELEQRLKKYF